ncbi:extracellular solute-binding protein [Nocardioides terrisoli]|uniref:extracellular solute-binding protein n=1 Tax=Nocardioides terrisoli TaxID=3388267 RepID=UPI00287B9686|nr:extracellular solute-binding protein [Nocardioides marmorisolisilvae]
MEKLNSRWVRRAGTAVAIVGAVAVAAGCATASGAGTGARSVGIAGFSVLQTANKQVIADFQKTAAGKGVAFRQSYGASGDESRAVLAGQKVDEVHLSLEPDVAKLVDGGVVAKDWADGPEHGVITQSVVVMVVRKGNPDHITGWNDLVRPGVRVVTPNPGSSGSAKWNILAAYGSQIAQGRSPAQATTYLKQLIAHTVALPGSGHDATTAFQGGTGDVLLSYEDEAIEARQAGADFDYVVPAQTLLIQNAGALTENASPAAKSFLAFQLSKQGQTDYAKQGFRPLISSIRVPVEGANDPSNPFPQPQTLLTIDKDFGGWKVADPRFFDPTHGIVTKLLAAAGKS